MKPLLVNDMEYDNSSGQNCRWLKLSQTQRNIDCVTARDELEALCDAMTVLIIGTKYRDAHFTRI